MNFKNLKTRTKFIVSFSIILALFLIVSFMGIYNLSVIDAKHVNMEVLNQSEADLFAARLNVRIFIHLRDTQYYSTGLGYIEKVKTDLNSLKSRLDTKENLELADNYSKVLQEYEAVMQKNHDAVLAQKKSIESRAEIRKEINSIFEKTGLPENHRLNYYFVNARLSGTYIYALAKPEYYEEAKRYIKMAIQESENSRLPEITSLLNDFDKVMDEFMAAYTASKESENELMQKGKEIIEISDKMQANLGLYIKSSYRSTMILIIVCTVLSVLISIAVIYLLTNYLVSMIKKGCALAKTYAEGNLVFQVPESDLAVKDELGDLARAMVGMGNKIKEIIGGVLTSAVNLESASFQLSSTSQQISQGASEQASAVEEVSSSMEQMSSNIFQSADNSQQAEKIAKAAASGIEEIAAKAQKAMEANRIIAEKITIINDIAFQTNILALNAAVEAARAGEQGRGFAVVAAEVRKLAERSKLAADEIVTLSKTSLDLVEETAAKMNAIIPDIDKTSNLVVEITASSAEQNNGAEQINNSLMQLNNVTQQNAAASEELATSAEEMTSQAELLKEQVSYFNIGKDISVKAKGAQSISHPVFTNVRSPKAVSKQSASGNGISIKLSDDKDDSYDKY